MTLNDFADLVTVVGIFFVAAGLMLSIQQFKFSRTMDYMGHLSDPSMIETRTLVDEWLASSNDDNTRIQALEKDRKLYSHVRVFLSFCNQIAIAYRFGAIHKSMAFNIWFPFVPYYWDQLKFYILWQRSQGYKVGENLENFAKDIQAFQSKQGKAIYQRKRHQ